MIRPEINSVRLGDVVAISELYQGANYSESYRSFVESCIRDYPAAKATTGNKLIGFAYTNRFAPDILELDNIYVAANYRNQRIGKALLSYIEQRAYGEDYKAIILVNSDLYPRFEIKLPATSFYLQNGYTKSFETPHSQVFTRLLEKSELHADGLPTL